MIRRTESGKLKADDSGLLLEFLGLSGEAKGLQKVSRAIEVVKLMCNGFTVSEIAAVLQVSTRTIRFYRQKIYGFLNIKNKNELVRIALYLGVVKIDELNFDCKVKGRR